LVDIDLASRLVELAAGVGLIASCLLLYRFFRGGIMEQPFIIFSVGSVVFFADRTISILVSLQLVPANLYTVIFEGMETLFVILFTSGFLLLYRNWRRLQHQTPQKNAIPASFA
jgi:hypothetical protein